MLLSVIVCTRNRAYAITPCLESIARAIAHVQPLEAEIIVVDNGSTDDTANVITAWAKDCACPVRLITEPKKGVSAGRNAGIKNAKGEHLIFTDDDCQLDQNYIADLQRHIAEDGVDILRGGMVELGNKNDLPLTIQTYPHHRKWHKQYHTTRVMPLAGGMILGCNVAISKSMVQKIGFFDELIGPGTAVPAGEDTDFFFRAYNANIPLEYVPDMIVRHFHGRKTEDEAKALIRNYVEGAGALYAKFHVFHPNIYSKFNRILKKIFPSKPQKSREGHHVVSFDIPKKEKIKLAMRGARTYIKLFILHLLSKS